MTTEETNQTAPSPGRANCQTALTHPPTSSPKSSSKPSTVPRPTLSPTYIPITGSQKPTALMTNATLLAPQEALDVFLEGISQPLTGFQVSAFETVSLQFLRMHLPITVNATTTSIVSISRFQVEQQQLLIADPKNAGALIQVPTASSRRRILSQETPLLSIRCQVDGSQRVLSTNNGTKAIGNDFIETLARFLILNYPSYLSALSKDPKLQLLWNQSSNFNDGVPSSNGNNNIIDSGTTASGSSGSSRRSTQWNLLGSALGLSIVACAAIWLVRRVRRRRDQQDRQQRASRASVHQTQHGGMASIGPVATVDSSSTPPPAFQQGTMDIVSEESESGWNSGSYSTDDDGYRDGSSSSATPSPPPSSGTHKEHILNCDKKESDLCDKVHPSLVEDVSSDGETPPPWHFATTSHQHHGSVIEWTRNAVLHHGKP